MKLPNETFISNGKIMTGLSGRCGGLVGVCGWNRPSRDCLLISTGSGSDHFWNVELNREQALSLALLLIEKAQSLPSP